MSKTLGSGFMGYMETCEAPFYRVETNCGTFYVPGDCGDMIEDCVEGTFEPEDVERVEAGILWRMTAPGYLDSTDWSFATDESEAEEEAREMYDLPEDETDDEAAED